MHNTASTFKALPLRILQFCGKILPSMLVILQRFEPRFRFVSGAEYQHPLVRIARKQFK